MALIRSIHKEVVLEADSCVSLSGRPIILILYWKLYLCSCSIESPIFSTRDDSKFKRDQSCLRLFADSVVDRRMIFPKIPRCLRTQLL